MNRRDAFRNLLTSGLAASAVDVAGNITAPEGAAEKFMLVLRPGHALTAEAASRIREQFDEACSDAEIGCVKVVVLPHGMELSSIKSDGTVCSTDNTLSEEMPWMGANSLDEWAAGKAVHSHKQGRYDRNLREHMRSLTK